MIKLKIFRPLKLRKYIKHPICFSSIYTTLLYNKINHSLLEDLPMIFIILKITHFIYTLLKKTTILSEIPYIY